MQQGEATETILIVDDEEPVRRTFLEWLQEADLGCCLLTADDAATALQLADRQRIDLAILDWNLGAGQDGLQLLEDLTLFNPDIVAILVTGYANQATPLMALRMGVRDYLDKNHDLDRATFLRAVRRQLERIRPARQQKRFHDSLASFRAAVERILPLVQTASSLHDPLPLPTAVRGLLAFVRQVTQASDGVLLIHSYDPQRQPAELTRVLDANGQPIEGPLVPFSRSLAASVISLQAPHVLSQLDRLADEGAVALQPFEQGRRSVLAVPVAVASGLQVVLELFDRQHEGQPAEFGSEQLNLASRAAELAGEMLRLALAERHTHQLLFDALAAALRSSDEVALALRESTGSETGTAELLEPLRASLPSRSEDPLDAETTLRLAEAIRVLGQRHGRRAIQHCVRLVEDLRELLDEVSGEASS